MLQTWARIGRITWQRGNTAGNAHRSPGDTRRDPALQAPGLRGQPTAWAIARPAADPDVRPRTPMH